MSCQKNQPVCSGNCVNITISGSTYIKTNGDALANIPVEVNWFTNSYCIGCTYYKVAAGQSGSDGKFAFNTTLDSSLFKNYYLSVRVPSDTNYIIIPPNGAVNFGANFIEERFSDFNSGALQNLKFEYYPKTILTIKLHRILSDTFNYFSVNHSFTSRFAYSDYIITGPQFAMDTIIKVPTSSDIYTKIVWTKTITGVQTNQLSDSLICPNNGTAVYSIDY